MSVLHPKLLQDATLSALLNWSRYQEEYEHFQIGGQWKDCPLFFEEQGNKRDDQSGYVRFRLFCADYGLSRTIHHKDRPYRPTEKIRNEFARAASNHPLAANGKILGFTHLAPYCSRRCTRPFAPAIGAQD